MTLAFGILSSHEHPGAIAQLVDALGPQVLVWIHHDPSKGERPALRRPNVRFITNPVKTAWGEWSLCEAALRLQRAALVDPTWRYFQLLSGSCLPIKPLADFERHVDASVAPVNMDAVALAADPVALMSHGFRAYARADSVGHRVLRRLRRWYLGRDDTPIDRQGLAFSTRASGSPPTARSRLALGSMRWIACGAAPGIDHPFGVGRLQCYVGSTWWGARREVCEFVVAQPEDGPLQRFFKRVLIPDEFYFQTLLGNSPFCIGESNHLVSRFDGAHPSCIGPDALPVLGASPRHFARKFPDDPSDPLRLAVLARLEARLEARRRTLPVRPAQERCRCG